MDDEQWDDTPIAAAARRAAQMNTGRSTVPKPEQPRLITVANQKGGVGKTLSLIHI